VDERTGREDDAAERDEAEHHGNRDNVGCRGAEQLPDARLLVIPHCEKSAGGSRACLSREFVLTCVGAHGGRDSGHAAPSNLPPHKRPLRSRMIRIRRSNPPPPDGA